jgi:hypothetical protein
VGVADEDVQLEIGGEDLVPDIFFVESLSFFIQGFMVQVRHSNSSWSAPS